MDQYAKGSKIKYFYNKQKIDKITISYKDKLEEVEYTNNNLTIYIHKSNNIAYKGLKAAMVYFHGGGAVSLSAEIVQPWIARHLNY